MNERPDLDSDDLLCDSIRRHEHLNRLQTLLSRSYPLVCKEHDASGVQVPSGIVRNIRLYCRSRIQYSAKKLNLGWTGLRLINFNGLPIDRRERAVRFAQSL